LLTTGEVAENCAEQFSYTREQQDRFGMESHIKASHAQKNGYFEKEIVPMKATMKDHKTGEKKT
jgi:acetyl-CoA acyltransferase 1